MNSWTACTRPILGVAAVGQPTDYDMLHRNFVRSLRAENAAPPHHRGAHAAESLDDLRAFPGTGSRSCEATERANTASASTTDGASASSGPTLVLKTSRSSTTTERRHT